MLNRYPLWKYLMVIVVIAIGFLYAAPNLYGEDPALQVSASRGAEVKLETLDQVKETLDEAKIPVKHAAFEHGFILIRFNNTEDQLKARDIVANKLGDNFITALNLAPSTPAWLEAIGAAPLKLGLDLRGGVHFLMEVDMAEALAKQQEQMVQDFRAELRTQKIRYSGVRRVGDQVGRDACRVEVGEGLALTHADGIGLAERLDHLGAQCWRAVRQVGAPDADVEQLRPREQPPPRHIGCQAGEAEGVAGPGQALGRVGVEAGDEGWHRVGRLQHQRGVPGFAGEDLAAHVDEAHGGVAELGGEPGEGVGAVAAEGAQVAFGEAGEDQPATGQQGGGEVGEQQVAEVVPVEGAQQDRRGGHRAFEGSAMGRPESTKSP